MHCIWMSHRTWVVPQIHNYTLNFFATYSTRHFMDVARETWSMTEKKEERSTAGRNWHALHTIESWYIFTWVVPHIYNNTLQHSVTYSARHFIDVTMWALVHDWKNQCSAAVRNWHGLHSSESWHISTWVDPRIYNKKMQHSATYSARHFIDMARETWAMTEKKRKT